MSERDHPDSPCPVCGGWGVDGNEHDIWECQACSTFDTPADHPDSPVSARTPRRIEL